MPGHMLCVTKGLSKVITKEELQTEFLSYRHEEQQHHLFSLSWQQWPHNNRSFTGVGGKLFGRTRGKCTQSKQE